MKFNAKRLLSLFLTTLIAFSTLGNVAAESIKTDLNTSVSSDVVLNESNIAQNETDSSLPAVKEPSSDVQSSPSVAQKPSSDVQSSPSVAQKPSSDVQSSSSIAQDASSVSSSGVIASSSQSVPASSSSIVSSLPASDIISSSVPNSGSSSNLLDLPITMTEPEMSIEERIAAAPTMEEMAQNANANGTMVTDNRSETQVTPFVSRQRGAALNLKNIVIFMRFKGQAEYISSSAVDTLNKVYNNFSDPTVSLNEFVNTISYKKLSVESQFYPQDSSSQVISVELDQPLGYFLRYDATKNAIGYKDENERDSREEELIKNAFNAVNAQNPGAFSEGVDVHGAPGGGADSFIDAVTFAYLPENLPVKVDWSDLLWPHKDSFVTNAPSAGGVTLRDYNLLDAASLLDTNGFSSKVVTHEFFHILGMPDLYRYIGNGNPVKYYDIMGAVSFASPQSLLQYNIRNYMGFAPELQQITSTQKGVTLNAAQYADANEKSAVIVKSPINTNEFFVVEMKNQTSFDSLMPNAKGLLVYRINPSVKKGNMNGPPDFEYVSRANDVSNTSATGDYELATLNLPSQLAPGEQTHRSSVGKAIDSANTSFDNETLFYADGTNSGVIIDNLTVSPDGSSMTFDVTVPSDSGVEDSNGWVTKDGERFYLGQDKVSYKGWQKVEERWYHFDETTGAQQKGWQYKWEGDVRRQFYYDANGELLAPGFGTLNGLTRYVDADGMMHSGWLDNGGKRYYTTANGVPLTGMQRINNQDYWFGNDSALVPNTFGWVTAQDGSRFYFSSANSVYKGWQKIEGRWYHLDEATGAQQKGWQYKWEGDVRRQFYYDANGELLAPGFGTLNGLTRYVDADGMMHSGWLNNDGKRYYTTANGVPVKGLQLIDNVEYWFNDDGVLSTEVIGWKTDSDGQRYFYGANNQRYKGWQKVEGRWYHLDETTGAQQKGWQYKWEGPVKRQFYYDASGELLAPGFGTLNGLTRFVDADGMMHSGWLDNGGKRYYTSANGVPLTGMQRINNQDYWFGNDGALVPNTFGWVTAQDGSRFYFSSANSVYKGWQKIADRWYHLDETTGAQQKGWQYKWEGPVKRQFYYDASGELLAPGFGTLNGLTRYVDADGMMHSGWLDNGGKRYYTSANGVPLTGLQIIDNTRYFFNDDGEMQKGWQTDSDGQRYYFDENGLNFKGWQKVEGRWYHFNETSGAQQKGWQYKWEGQVNKQFYYDANGELMAPGWGTLNGLTRYVELDGMMHAGWLNDGAKRYYTGFNGVPLKGLQTIDNQDYWFDNNGVLVPNTLGWITGADGERYYFSSANKAFKGWQKVADRWYHFDETTGAQQKGWQYKWEGPVNRQFYYDANGELLAPGWGTLNGLTRYVDADGMMHSGWLNDENDNKIKYYTSPNGVPVYGWQIINNSRYFFNDKGHMLTGWQIFPDGQRYYFNSNGQNYLGWQIVSGRWYHFDEKTGAQQKGWQYKWDGSVNKQFYYDTNGELMAAGWGTLNGLTRYVDADGMMHSGWLKDAGKMYYTSGNGVPLKGWILASNNRWYHLEETTGVQLTGWQYKLEGSVNRQFYYDANGELMAPGWGTLNGLTRYVDADGMMHSGWLSVGDYKYYTSPNGVPLTGVQIVDGRTHIFDTAGRFVAPPTINNVLYTESGTDGIVKISVTPSSLTYLHATAFSWDGGKTWTYESARTYKLGTTIPANTIQVRDAVGNITVYGNEVVLKSNGPFYGIDVSAYQGDIDWAAVKASGVNFAIIRALTWSKSVGYYVIDPYFEYNVRQAKNNGIQVGAYLFSYAFSTNEIFEEVNFFYNSPEMQRLRNSNIKFDFPVYIDFEWDKILDNTSYSQRTEMVRSGMIRLEQLGFYPGFYSNHNWAEQYYDAKSLMAQGYDFWYARYPANPNLTAGPKQYGYDAEIWQYASDGRVNGINGNVDMNICYVDYKKIINAGGSSSGGDAQRTLSVYDLNSNKPVMGSVEDILSQIVMNEVGSWSNAPEVLKAQAVAAHSWVLYQQQHGDPIPKVGLATPNAAVIAAVNAVKSQTLFYGDSVINAAYGSASASMTNSASNMWGLDLPYLNNQVYSPETAYRGRSSTLSYQTVRNAVVKLVGEGAANANAPANWITSPSYDSYGYLKSISVCGQSVGGGKFYENFYGLISPNFSIRYNGNNTWSVTTNGNGHCVGMSQYGAYTFATANGSNYQQILAYYYPGSTLK